VVPGRIGISIDEAMKKDWCIGLALAFAHAETAGAQGIVHVRPLFGVSQMYDSNLFFTSLNREADFVTRMTPGFESEYRSEVMALVGRYSRDIERYANHADLTSINTREHATVDSTYRPTRRLTLTAGAELSRTQIPGELNVGTGLTFTRAAARRVSARSSLARQFGRITEGRMEYTFTGDHLAGGVGIRTHTAAAVTERQLSSRDTVIAGYRAHQFLFGTSGAGSTSATSHALTVGWTRTITRQASLSIDAGPQVTNGSPAAEISAAVHYRARPVDLSLAYGRRQTTIIGLPGTSHTQSMTGSAAWTLLRHSLRVQVSPAFYQSAHPLLRADVYRLGLDVDRRITDRLSVGVGLDMNVQRNRDIATFARQIAMIRLVATPVARH
jgi:hypothetical protein